MKKTQGAVFDRRVGAVPSVSVTVYNQGTTNKPTIYSDNGANPQANPFQTDSLGRWAFYVANGRYDIEFSGAMINTFKMEDVLVQEVADAWLFSSNYDSINAAVNVIGSTKTTLIVNQDESLVGNLTIPSTLCLKVLKLGSIVKASTFSLTINGQFEAGLYQVFSGFSAGDVTFGIGSVKEVIPEWWGENTIPGTTNMSIEFLSAVASITMGRVKFQAQSYKITETWTGKKGIILEGQGIGRTTITFGGTGTFWIDVPTPESEGLYDDMGVVEMRINALTGALGAIRHGRLVADYSGDNFSDRWQLKNLWVTGAGDAGSFGFCLTQLGRLDYENIWVDNFERNIVLDRGTANVYKNIRTITGVTNGRGIEWPTGVSGHTQQEYVYGLDCLIGGLDSEALKIDAGNINLHGVYLEKYGAPVATCLLRLGSSVTQLNITGINLSNAGTVINDIVTDNSATIYQRGVLTDVKFGGTGACSFGTNGSEYAWVFVNPNDFAYDALATAINNRRIAVIGGKMPELIMTVGAEVRFNLAAQSIPNATETVLTYENETWDTDAMANLGVNNDKITITKRGIYQLNGIITWAEDATGIRQLRIVRSNTEIMGGLAIPVANMGGGVGNLLTITCIALLDKDDYLDLRAFQTSGGALNAIRAKLTVQRISNN